MSRSAEHLFQELWRLLEKKDPASALRRLREWERWRRFILGCSGSIEGGQYRIPPRDTWAPSPREREEKANGSGAHRQGGTLAQVLRREGVSLTALDKIAAKQTDNAAAALMQAARDRIFRKFVVTERTTTTASLQSNAMLSDHLPNGNNNDKNKGEQIQKLRQTVNVLQAHSWIGKCLQQ